MTTRCDSATCGGADSRDVVGLGFHRSAGMVSTSNATVSQSGNGLKNRGLSNAHRTPAGTRAEPWLVRSVLQAELDSS